MKDKKCVKDKGGLTMLIGQRKIILRELEKTSRHKEEPRVDKTCQRHVS